MSIRDRHGRTSPYHQRSYIMLEVTIHVSCLREITTGQAVIHPSEAGAVEEAAPQVWMGDVGLPHFSLDPPEQRPLLGRLITCYALADQESKPIKHSDQETCVSSASLEQVSNSYPCIDQQG